MDEFIYDEHDVKILANAIEEACKSVSCDLKCFDWMVYNTKCEDL